MKQSVISRRAVFAITVASLAGLASLYAPGAISAPNGEQTFKVNCAACHAGGGNIMNSKKPLKGSSKMAAIQTFKAYLLKPSGTMTPFPQIANDAPTLQALYNYCKTFK